MSNKVLLDEHFYRKAIAMQVNKRSLLRLKLHYTPAIMTAQCYVSVVVQINMSQTSLRMMPITPV
jgi:hypothetical protein